MTGDTRHIRAALALVLLAMITSADGFAARHTTADDARAAFERLRSLEGTWSFTSGTDQGEVSYELVSEGTAILERVRSREHANVDMISVFHLDGDRLVLQHFCGSGNQPRLIAATLDGDEIRFTFERAGNLRTQATGHIHAATFRMPIGRPFESTWTWRERGVESTVTRRHRVVSHPSPPTASLSTTAQTP